MYVRLQLRPLNSVSSDVSLAPTAFPAPFAIRPPPPRPGGVGLPAQVTRSDILRSVDLPSVLRSTYLRMAERLGGEQQLLGALQAQVQAPTGSALHLINAVSTARHGMARHRHAGSSSTVTVTVTLLLLID